MSISSAFRAWKGRYELSGVGPVGKIGFDNRSRREQAAHGAGVRFCLIPGIWLLSAFAMSAALVDEYFPVRNGDTMRYQLHQGSRTTATESFRQTSFGGRSVLALNCNAESAGPADGRIYLAYSGPTLICNGISNQIGSFTFNPPVTLLDDQLLAGGGTRNGTAKTTWLSRSVNVTFSVSLRPADLFTVPLGTFRGCKEVTITFGGWSAGMKCFEDAFHWMLAPEFGIIADYAPSSWPTADGNYFEIVGGTKAGIEFPLADYSWQSPFGWVYDAGGGWYYHAGFGWVLFADGQWVWSNGLQGWVSPMADGRTLWSAQWRWMTPFSDDPRRVQTSTLGMIHLGEVSGVAIADGWAVSDRFGFVWPAGDGVWFYSSQFGWLGATADGGIWCVSQNRWL